MIDYKKYLRASDGTGRAVLAHIQQNRNQGSTVIDVDNTENWDEFFIVTTGTIGPDGFITEASLREMFAHLDDTTGNIIIDEMCPGFPDDGNLKDQVAVIKQTTAWADVVADVVNEVYEDMQEFAQKNGDWRSLPEIPTVVSCDGMSSYLIRYAGVDHTDKLSEGMKLRLPRTGTVPTQSMQFVKASQQYARKTNPTGLNGLTNGFTILAKVWVDDYPMTTSNGIIARRQGDSNGFSLSMDTNGQLSLTLLNGGGFRNVNSRASLPVGRWVPVAFQAVDIGAVNFKVFIDGVEVQAYQQAVNGSISTASVPNVDLVIGSRKSDGFLETWNGKIQSVQIFTRILTAQEIKDSVGRDAPINTTGLVLDVRGNGSWNDLSSNGNNLAPINGAINNAASNHLNANEHVKITAKPKLVNGNTEVRVFAGQGSLPQGEALAASAYSTVAVPVGFPAEGDYWRIKRVFRFDAAVGGPIQNRWHNPSGLVLNMPEGKWKYGWKSTVHSGMNSGSSGDNNFSLLRASGGLVENPTGGNEDNMELTFSVIHNSNVSSITELVPAAAESKVRLTTPDTVHLCARTISASNASRYLAFRGDYGMAVIYAEADY